MSNDTNTKKILFTVAVLELVLLCVYGFFALKVRAENEIVRNALSELALEQQKYNKAHDLKDLLEDISEERAELNQFFISKKSIVTFIQELESLGEIALVNLTIKNVAVNMSESGDEFLEVTLSIDGTWGQVFYFGQLLERMPKVKHFTIMSFDKVGEEGNSWDGAFTIKAPLFDI
jgi:hypothetical protein